MKKLNSFIKERKLLIGTGKQKVSLSDLAKGSGVVKANIGNIVDDLHKAGFIRLEKLSKILT